MKNWEEIRANWVNGNLSDVRDTFMSMRKKDAFKVIRDAVVEHYNHLPSDILTDGGIVDLIEILGSIDSLCVEDGYL